MSEGGISRDLQAEKASAAAPTSSKVISIEQSECCGLGGGPSGSSIQEATENVLYLI
jgi:hypothetical protein